MLAAMASACREQGVAPVSVAEVCSRSRISRRTFYEMFADREECFLATLDEAIDRAAARVVPAWEAERRWADALRAGLIAFLGYLDAEPTFGGLLIVSSLAAGPAALERRAQAVAHVIGAVDRGRHEPRAPAGVTCTAAEGAVGAVLAILHARLTLGGKPTLAGSARGARSRQKPNGARPRRLVELTGELMSILIGPYLGAAAAQRELRRPVPKTASGSRPTPDPLAELKMRLTYRTIRVLHAIAAQDAHAPGLSNRQVSAAAEIADQGQTSKLLHRLKQSGLLENDGATGPRSAANAWRLTDTGRAVVDAIADQEGRP